MATRQVVSLDEIEKHPVDVAERMWKDVQQLQTTSKWDSLSAAGKIEEFNVLGYGNFITKHTFVSRHLIVNGEYSSKAFLMYLIQSKRVGYNSQEQYAERQADYTKWLWQTYNPMHSDDEAMTVWNDTKKSILDELTSFKRDYEAAKQNVDNHRANVNQSLKNDLKDMLTSKRNRERITELYIQSRCTR